MAFILTSLLTAYDGGLVGAVVAVLAGTSWVKYLTTSSTLRMVRDAPSVRVSDLNSLLPEDGGGKLVFLRGQIQPKPKPSPSGIPAWLGPKNHGALVSQPTGVPAVVVQHTDTYLYNDCSLFKECWSTVRSVPFVLAEGGEQHRSSYVNVNLESSTHPLPLVHPRPHPMQHPSYFNICISLIQLCPKLVSKEESILPVGKEITAVGICRNRDGALETRSCKQLPYFLTDMMKVDIAADLARHAEFLFCSGIVLGTLSISILGYAIFRKWQRWKDPWHGSQNRICYRCGVVFMGSGIRMICCPRCSRNPNSKAYVLPLWRRIHGVRDSNDKLS